MIDTEMFVIPLEPDRFLVYAPLRQSAFVGNARMVNVIDELRSFPHRMSGRKFKTVQKLLRRVQFLDDTPEYNPITNFNNDPCPTNLTLFLTTACNLRCTYCYASAGDKPARNMPFSVARKGIDFVVANAARLDAGVVELNFHGGGEPTVNWETLTDAYDYALDLCERHDLELIASTATNGIVGQKRLEWIVDHLSGVSISFDGIPEAHDKHRKTVSGGGSSDTVMNTLRFFDECDFAYGIRITVTKDQIPLLSKSVEFVCANFHPQSIQVEPSYQLGRWREAPSAETQEFIEAYRAAQSFAWGFGKQISFSGARLGTMSNHFCGVSQDSFGLTADGSVSGCYEVFDDSSENAETFIYGHPAKKNGGYEFDLEKLNHLRSQAVQHREFCAGCFAKWSCGGDCYNKAIVASGSRSFAGSDRCHIIRELTKDQILQAIADNGGVYWRGKSMEEDGLYDAECAKCDNLEDIA